MILYFYRVMITVCRKANGTFSLASHNDDKQMVEKFGESAGSLQLFY